jgi:hypothetical protein
MVLNIANGNISTFYTILAEVIVFVSAGMQFAILDMHHLIISVNIIAARSAYLHWQSPLKIGNPLGYANKHIDRFR